MPSPASPVITSLLREPSAALAGTDVRLTLPLTRSLLNEILAARPPDTPVKQLLIDPESGNRFRVHLTAHAPLVGSVTRRITFATCGPVAFPDQPWLRFDIVDGLGFLDRSLISLLQGQIESRLPRGVELTSHYLRLHVPALLNHLGYQQLAPLLHNLEVHSEANRLILHLHLKTD
ncbi:hypothetical protein [Neolewinella litorea]|uniref:Uncharacterized protein n=1 Tax=Neolewinella litorea TaxID=2562452 RepID=A0A4S4NPM5_9BACT|nr:hypothetical protein [Neolewinella litorea]THH40361.1 hypothetical protein E4021_06395 [Neolewinella litorea]